MHAFTNEWVDRFSRAYDSSDVSELTWFSATAGPELCKLVIDGVIARGSSIVDLGCGAGVEAMFLAAQGMRVTGVDISERALNIAREVSARYGLRVNWLHGNVLAVPLEDQVADVVNDSFIFHNVRDEARDRYAREVHRLLRPGGLFVLRGFSDGMTAGTGPRRLSSDELLSTFLPHFRCERLVRFRNLPTEKRADQWHWLAIWKKRDASGTA